MDGSENLTRVMVLMTSVRVVSFRISAETLNTLIEDYRDFLQLFQDNSRIVPSNKP
jgi:hypothetical protein